MHMVRDSSPAAPTACSSRSCPPVLRPLSLPPRAYRRSIRFVMVVFSLRHLRLASSTALDIRRCLRLPSRCAWPPLRSLPSSFTASSSSAPASSPVSSSVSSSSSASSSRLADPLVAGSLSTRRCARRSPCLPPARPLLPPVASSALYPVRVTASSSPSVCRSVRCASLDVVNRLSRGYHSRCCCVAVVVVRMGGSTAVAQSWTTAIDRLDRRNT